MNSSLTTSDNHDKEKLSPDTMIILVRCNRENVKIHDIYINKNKFKIGRAIDCDEYILTPLISRNHCILIYNNDHWTITDLSSTHTKLNGNNLERGVPTQININDTIQLSGNDDYKFIVAKYIDDEPEKKKLRLSSQRILDEEILKQKLFTEEQELKRKELELQLIEKQNEQEKLKQHLDDLLKSQYVFENKTDQLNETIKTLEEKIKCGSEIELHMQQNYNQLLSTVENQKKQFDERLNDEREKWQQTLQMSHQEKIELEKKMTDEMTMWREQQQNEWSNVVNNLVQREKNIQINLMNEKKLLEQRLQEANDALKEKSALAEELKNSIEHSKDSVAVTNQQISDIIDLTVETASSSNDMNSIINKVGDIMDEQLTCQICSELFVTSVTLNCSHTFCQYCIYLWMNKKRECPICRGLILSITRSLVLDSFIEKMVNSLSIQHKKQRDELCAQRKVMSQRLGTPSILTKRPPRKLKNSR